jgi:hypothetical protein
MTVPEARCGACGEPIAPIDTGETISPFVWVSFADHLRYTGASRLTCSSNPTDHRHHPVI